MLLLLMGTEQCQHSLAAAASAAADQRLSVAGLAAPACCASASACAVQYLCRLHAYPTDAAAAAAAACVWNMTFFSHATSHICAPRKQLALALKGAALKHR
jgi:hypothetical protein